MPTLLLKRPRQKRLLVVPKPARRGNIKIPYEGWLACARHVLIEEGFAAVKVDRLAKRLKVTRGGFYHHFGSPEELQRKLVEIWRKENRIAPESFSATTPQEGVALLHRIVAVLLREEIFDHRFDMAVRDWARVAPEVDKVVHEVDEDRMRVLHLVFRALGYDSDEAVIRARVFYYHQIGYYALGVEEQTKSRLEKLPTYLAVLCGEKYLKLVRRGQILEDMAVLSSSLKNSTRNL